MRHLFLPAFALMATAVVDAAEPPERATIDGGAFFSVLPQGKNNLPVTVRPFALDKRPVTNAEFLAFVRSHPQWRRDRIAPIFADSQYLAHWHGPTEPGSKARPQQPVTHVSWFAAKSYCESRGYRLPRWYEWEYAAAASETLPDARNDAAWRQRILDWYAQPGAAVLPEVAGTSPNFFGVSDMHGLVWEWVLDFNALLVSSDSREQGGADRLQFCGEGALGAADRDNYAVLMRVAFLSSLEASYTTANLGFRCAGDLP